MFKGPRVNLHGHTCIKVEAKTNCESMYQF